MELFNKIKKQLSLHGKPVKTTTEQQLEKFHTCWTFIHSEYFMQDQKPNRKVHVQLTEIPSYLKLMTDILVQEEIKLEEEQTGVCMEYMLKHGVLNILVNISELDFPLGIRGETIRFISTLVNLLDVKFLIQAAIHLPTLKLLKLCTKEDLDSSIDKFNNFYIDDVIDLLYTLCSKIHSAPMLLNIFFYDKRWLTTPQKQDKKEVDNNNTIIKEDNEKQGNNTNNNSNDSPQYECLLFSYLLRFVHREGKSGDYARTGILFLVEVASGNFRDYILYHSDLCPILSAGLGALYSQLPRKLLVKYNNDEDNSLMKLTKSIDLNDEDGLDEFQVASSPQFKILIDSFLKLLEFLQDILIRCPSRAICLNLLTNIKHVFLESILYRSMMESSDLDGSTVAVISYIEIILSTLKDGELVDLFITYLINGEDDDLILNNNNDNLSIKSNNKDDVLSIKSNNSLKEEENEYKNNKSNSKVHLAFNLKDLLFNNLRSKSIPTILAALKLLNTIITNHGQYLLLLLNQENYLPVTLPPTSKILSPTISTFEEVYKINNNNNNNLNNNNDKYKSYTTISNHHQEIQSYFLLLNNMDPRFNKDGFIPGYEPYLKQVENIYNNYRTRDHFIKEQFNRKGHTRQQTIQLNKQQKELSNNNNKVINNNSDIFNNSNKFLLKRNDPILQILLELLSNFFDNHIELNLLLSQTLSGLVSCPYIMLDEWVYFQSNILNYKYKANNNNNNNNNINRDNILLNDDKIIKHKDNKLNLSIQINSIDNKDYEDEYEILQVKPLSFKLLTEDDEDNNINIKLDQVPCNSPPLFDIFNQLAQQVDEFRNKNNKYDLWLEERRKQLNLFNLDKYTSAMISMSYQQEKELSPEIVKQQPSIFQRTLSLSYNTNKPMRKFSFLEAITTTNTEVPNSPGLNNFSNLFGKSEKDQPFLDNKKFLDNVLILQESIKEILAAIQVRRAFGIDQVLFL